MCAAGTTQKYGMGVCLESDGHWREVGPILWASAQFSGTLLPGQCPGNKYCFTALMPKLQHYISALWPQADPTLSQPTLHAATIPKMLYNWCSRHVRLLCHSNPLANRRWGRSPITVLFQQETASCGRGLTSTVLSSLHTAQEFLCVWVFYAFTVIIHTIHHCFAHWTNILNSTFLNKYPRNKSSFMKNVFSVAVLCS